MRVRCNDAMPILRPFHNVYNPIWPNGGLQRRAISIQVEGKRLLEFSDLLAHLAFTLLDTFALEQSLALFLKFQ